MSGSITHVISASMKSMVPAGVKDTLRKLKPRTRFQKDLEFNKEFYFSLVVFLVDLVVALVLIFTTRSPIALVWGLVAGAVVEVVLSFVVIKPVPKFSFVSSHARKIISKGKWVTGSAMFNYLFANTDDAVVGRVLSVGSLGIYQAAYKISTLPITEVAMVVKQVTFPVFVRFAEDKDRLRKAYISSILASGAFALAMGIFIFSFSKEIVLVLLGQNWLEAVPALKVLSVFGVIRAITVMSNSLFNSVKLQKYVTYYTFTSLVVLAVLIVPLTNQYGLVGAGIAAVIGSAFALAVSLVFTVKILR